MDAVREGHRGRRVDIDVVLGAVRAEAGAGDERGGRRAGRAGDMGAHRYTRSKTRGCSDGWRRGQGLLAMWAQSSINASPHFNFKFRL